MSAACFLVPQCRLRTGRHTELLSSVDNDAHGFGCVNDGSGDRNGSRRRDHSDGALPAPVRNDDDGPDTERHGLR